MYSNHQVLQNASRKIGIKLLDQQQIHSTFPDYTQVLAIIGEQRARVAENSVFISDNRYHLMHDNVIGIFGGRGSGKTSILFSLWERLNNDAQHDIILPIISPELISDNCSILLWVLSMLEDTVNELDAFLMKNESIRWEVESPYRSLPSCERHQPSLLKTEHQALLRNCSSMQDMRKYDYADAIEIHMHHFGTQYQLMRRLNRFWNLLANTQKRYRQSEKPPLIFIMFDDIDLAPERSMELLMSAYKYFSNANVVIILTAAMKMLRQVLTCRMYEKVVGSDFPSLIQGNELLVQRNGNPIDIYQIDRASDAAIEYLNKVIPQSSRFFLERFDTLDRKQLYRYPIDWKQSYDPTQNHSIPLDEFLSKALEESGLLTPNSFHSPTDNFFLTTIQDPEDPNKKRTVFAKEYYLLFGDKSRYLSNSCLVLMQTFEQLERIKLKMENAIHNGDPFSHREGEDYVREIYGALNNLLTTLISSHTRELEECNDWTPELLRYRYGHHYLFIHYSHLLEQYQKSSHMAEERISRELLDAKAALHPKVYEARRLERLREELLPLRKKTAVLFIMLNLLEHLTSIVAPLYYTTLGQGNRTRSIHGRTQLLEFLNQDALASDAEHNMVLFPGFVKATDLIHTYVDVLSEPNRFLQLSIKDSNRVSDYFSYVMQHEHLKNMLSLLPEDGEEQSTHMQWSVYTSCQDHPDWMRTVCAMLYLNKSGIQLLRSEFFSGMLQLFDDLALLPCLSPVTDLCRDAALDFALGWNLQATAVRRRALFEQLCSQAQSPTTPPSTTPTWESLTDRLVHPDLASDLNAAIVRYVQKKNFPFSAEMSDMDFSQTLCTLINELHYTVSKAISSWPLKFRIPPEHRFIILTALDNLCDISPQIQDFIEITTQNIRKFDPENEVLLDFYPIFNMMQSIRYRLKDSLSLAQTNEAWLFYNQYRPQLDILSEHMELVIESGREQEMQAQMDDLLTLLALLPDYFSAQFTITNEQQYTEFRVHADQSTAHNDYAAQIYLDFVRVFDPNSKEFVNSSYDTLRKMLIEVHTLYSDQILHELGVI